MNSAQKIIKICAICFAIFIISCILHGIFLGIRFIGGTYQSENRIDIKEKYTDIERLEIDLSSSDLTLEIGDEWLLQASGVSEYLKAKEENHKLKIKEEKNHFWNNHFGGTIVLTIPKNIKLSTLRISSGAGKMNINGITSDLCDISQGAGSISLSNSFCYNTKVDGGAGEILIEKSVLHDLDLDAGVGKIDIEAELIGSSKIDCGVGEVNLQLPKKENYEITAEKGIGSITIAEEDVKNDTIYGQGNNKIDIDGGVGSINIKFNE